MDVSFTNSRTSIALARRADTDWGSLTTEQRIRSIELDGYVVIPDLKTNWQRANQIFAAELDGDGQPDLVAGTTGSVAEVRCWRNNLAPNSKGSKQP